MIIWLASYPRSGNTFLRVLLKSVFGLETYSIYDDKFDIAKDVATTKIVGHKMLPDDFDLEKARNSEKLYVIKTHDHISSPYDKVIYLVRDGRECSLSYLNYIQSYHNEDCKIQDVLYGNVSFGSWGEHLDSWNANNGENSLILKFEDLVESPKSFLKEISNFIGIEEQANEIPNFEELHKINPKFFRRGKADSWKEELTPDDTLTFWVNSLPQMIKFYPQESPPELFNNTDYALKISELFNRQGIYFRAVVGELENQRNNLFGQRRFLLGQRKKTESQRKKLESQRKKLEGQKEELKNQVQTLENELHDTSEKLTRIRTAVSDVVSFKALKAPLKKYHAYKKLIRISFSNPI